MQFIQGKRIATALLATAVASLSIVAVQASPASAATKTSANGEWAIATVDNPDIRKGSDRQVLSSASAKFKGTCALVKGEEVKVSSVEVWRINKKDSAGRLQDPRKNEGVTSELKSVGGSRSVTGRGAAATLQTPNSGYRGGFINGEKVLQRTTCSTRSKQEKNGFGWDIVRFTRIFKDAAYVSYTTVAERELTLRN